MKQEYTQYRTSMKKLFYKQNYSKIISFGDWAENIITKLINDKNNAEVFDERNYVCQTILFSEYAYLFSKKIIQYFIPSIDLINFMINSVKNNINYDDLLNFLIESKIDESSNENCDTNIFVINFPNKSGFKSILITIYSYSYPDIKEKTKHLIYSIDDAIEGNMGVFDVENFKEVDNSTTKKYKFGSDEEKEIIDTDIYIRLFIGMCLYKKCFPQSVINGLPNDCRHPNHYNNAKTIKIVDEILELNSGDRTVTPHIRSGHFRLLSNECFKNKRYQVIFIKECFVKGKPITIENMDDRKLIQEAV